MDSGSAIGPLNPAPLQRLSERGLKYWQAARAMTLGLRVPGALAYFAAWLNPWQPIFRAPADSGLSFYAHRRDVIGRHIAKYGAHEPQLTRWIADRLAASNPGLFVDAGANIGWHALHAARQANVESVVAFEPDPFNAWLLDRNLAANQIDKVIVVASALGGNRGTVRLHRYKASNFGRHSAIADKAHGSSATVPLVDLDGALNDLGLADKPVAILKIDVEGYEPAVLAGASRTLSLTDAIVLEYTPAVSRAGGLSIEDMLARFERAGFAPFTLKPDGSLEALDVIALIGAEDQRDLIWIKRKAAAK
jgi:FkbM family methyltransferase